MRILIAAVFSFSLTGCLLTMFGVHHARARDAFVKAFGACEDVTVNGDQNDGWLWKAHGCGKNGWCWYGRPSGQMRCSTISSGDWRDRVVRRDLRCPRGNLEQRDIVDDQTEFRGCDRILWCTPDKADKIECTVPDDLSFALKQLSVESGCPAESIEQLQFFGTNLQNTYRLNACGNQFSCLIPLIQETDKNGKPIGDLKAGSRFGSQLTCKPVLGLSAPASDEPPPPPPSN